MFKYLRATQSILGLNARNLLYTLPENSKESRAIADSKLRFKRILQTTDISTPKTYAVIRTKEALEQFDWNKLPSSFVLKPNKGFGGEGIIVVYGEKKRKSPDQKREWIQADGKTYSKEDLSAHIRNILEGNFSLNNTPDRAFFEERLKNIPELKPFLYKGVPDIRLIVYNKVPIMAELRLPTRESNGKANLHAGGVGVGIDIASGITTVAIQHDKVIEIHPDTKMRLSGVTIPFWDRILEMAIKAQTQTDLGYIGVDIAIDREKGPVMLEVNARPGLAIQIANNDGLVERLKRVRRLKVKSIKRGIRLGKELFGGEVEEEVETLIGKKIIGLHTSVLIKGKSLEIQEVAAKVDTGATFSSIDTELARKLGFGTAIDYFNTYSIPTDLTRTQAKEFCAINEPTILHESPDITDISIIKAGNGITIRPIIEAEMVIEGFHLKTKFTVVDRTLLKYPGIIGAKDLHHFIIDPSRK